MKIPELQDMTLKYQDFKLRRICDETEPQNGIIWF